MKWFSLSHSIALSLSLFFTLRSEYRFLSFFIQKRDRAFKMLSLFVWKNVYLLRLWPKNVCNIRYFSWFMLYYKNKKILVGCQASQYFHHQLIAYRTSIILNHPATSEKLGQCVAFEIICIMRKVINGE